MIMYHPMYPHTRRNQMPPYQQPWPSYHGCCNHMPPYYYCACPYTFHPHHHHGIYSPYPAAYYVPPPVELPRYDYDKNNIHHCCGCNHKEELKQVDNKTSDSKDSPAAAAAADYPIMWLPESKENNYTHDSVPKQAQEDEQGNQFPFQVFWLPSKNVGKDYNLDHLVDEKATENNEGDSQTASQKEEEETTSKHVIRKVIPVKQVNANEENNPMVNSNSMDNNGSRSSPKTSKLPPVCLRIDPLPRKRKSSRSPSPGKKGRSNDSPKSSQQQQAQVLKKEQSEGNIKTLEQDNLAHVPMGKVEEEKKKNMSEHEAALVIQSVYRGFQVRKSQPLKKLRQIYQVRKMVFELRNCIQDLETSSSSIGLDGKKEVVIGETIMSLLLELDTVQGLHPFVREIRKSVAKELVGLQEKLDSLKSKTSSECSSEQVMHPQDDGSQGNVQMDICENHEHKATESRCDDYDAENVVQQLEKSTAIQDNFDQAPAESDAVICENQEVEGKESQEGCNTIGEMQLESHKDEAQTECDEALGLCEVKGTDSQGGCNSIGEPSQVEAPSECDEALGLSENHDMELEDNKVQMLVKVDQAQTQMDICKNHEHNATESRCDNYEAENVVQQLEKSTAIQDKFYEAPAPAAVICENQEVEGKVSQEGCNTIGEAPTECDEALGLCEVKGTESQGGCNRIGEPSQVEVPSVCDEALGLGGENHDMELEDKEVQMLVNVDSMVYENGDDGNVQMGANDVEGKGVMPMEENEKLRELMNEQLGVIRELTGRVKDLEKKLEKSKNNIKKKKIKVNKGRRRHVIV